MILSILIPTYNRENFLLKNIQELIGFIRDNRCQKMVEIIVSNNNSADDTHFTVERLIGNLEDIRIKYFKQSTNIGLEKNALFLLEKAAGEYVMYLGDDDYLPAEYLEIVLSLIKFDKLLTCIIPNRSFYENGVQNIVYPIKYFIKQHDSSFKNLLKYSFRAHQLSGIVIKSNELLSVYNSYPEKGNIYLFIFFLTYNIKRGNMYYLDNQLVEITINNKRYWDYDESGLLKEIFKNYYIVYPKSYLKRNLLCASVVFYQPFRLGFGTKQIFKSCKHLFKDSEIEILVKSLIVVIVTYHLVRKLKKYTSANRT